jgi:transcriptional regulator with XRE-family HTH domain
MRKFRDAALLIAVAVRLREVRGAATQEVFAERCGLTRNMIVQIETARTLPSVTTLVAIADGAGVSCDALLGRAPIKRARKQ